MTEKNHTPASRSELEQIFATTSMAQFLVNFSKQKELVSVGAFSLKLKLIVHRLPAANYAFNSYKN